MWKENKHLKYFWFFFPFVILPIFCTMMECFNVENPIMSLFFLFLRRCINLRKCWCHRWWARWDKRYKELFRYLLSFPKNRFINLCAYTNMMTSPFIFLQHEPSTLHQVKLRCRDPPSNNILMAKRCLLTEQQFFQCINTHFNVQCWFLYINFLCCCYAFLCCFVFIKWRDGQILFLKSTVMCEVSWFSTNVLWFFILFIKI